MQKGSFSFGFLFLGHLGFRADDRGDEGRAGDFGDEDRDRAGDFGDEDRDRTGDFGDEDRGRTVLPRGRPLFFSQHPVLLLVIGNGSLHPPGGGTRSFLQGIFIMT